MIKLFVKRRFSLIRLFLFAVFFSWVGNAFSQESFVEKSFFELPFFKEAENSRKIDELGLSGYQLFYLPKPYLSGAANANGSFENGFCGSSSQLSLNFVQNVLGLVTLDYGIENQVDVLEDNDFCFSLSPYFNVSMPIFAGPKIVSLHNNYGKNNYRLRKRFAELSYKVQLNENSQKYISEVGNFLFYRKMAELYQDKAELLLQRTKDYERLFALGKVNALEVSEKVSERLKFLQENVELQGKLIAARKNLSEMGVKTDLPDENLECFVRKWKKQYSHFFEEEYIQNEQELLRLDIANFQKIESYISQMPTISSGFSVFALSEECKFPDFSQGTWQFDFSLKIPLFRSFSMNVPAFLVKNMEMTELEKSKVIRKHESTRTERKNYVSIYESYRDSMENAAELEENRLSSYVELNKAGRLSNYDLKMQKNTAELSRLYAVYADLQLLVTKACFY